MNINALEGSKKKYLRLGSYNFHFQFSLEDVFFINDK